MILARCFFAVLFLLWSFNSIAQSSLDDLDIIFKHDFEKNTLGNYNYSEWRADWLSPDWVNRVEDLDIVKDTTSSNPSKCLQINFPYKSVGPNQGGTQWNTPLPAKYEEAYFSYDFKFMPKFEFQLGGKMPSICGGEIIGEQSTGFDGFTGGMMFNPGGYITFYFKYPDTRRELYGESIIWGDKYTSTAFSPSKMTITYSPGQIVHAIPGNWHNITYRMVLNSFSSSGTPNYDGILEGYFDGKLVIQASRILFRKTKSLAIDQIRIVSFFGGSGDEYANPIKEWLRLDNVMLYTFNKDITVPRGNTLSPSDRTINFWRKILSIPTKVPDAPLSLSLASNTKTGITIKWVDNSTNESNFIIERSSSSDGTFTEIGKVSANVTSFTNSSLPPGTKYYYRVKAVNSIGSSEYTTVLACSTVPLAIPSAPTSLSASQVTKNSVKLSWVDNSSNETGFKIYRSLSLTSDFSEIASVATNVISYTDNSLQPGTNYFYKIRSYNSDGNSEFTSAISITTSSLQIPIAPSNLITSQIDYTSAKMLWKDNSNNESGFEIERSGPNNLSTKKYYTIAANSTQFIDNGLTINSIYQYRIRSKNDDGVSSWSNTIEIVTPKMTPPIAPTNLKSTEFTDKSISITWDDNSNNEDAFIITRSLAIDPNSNVNISVAANDTSFKDTSLVSSTTYQYYIKAINLGGSSKTSNKNVATTLSKAELKRVRSNLIAYYNFGYNPDYIVYDQSGYADPVNLQVLNRSAVKWNDDNTLDVLSNTGIVSITPAYKIVEALKLTSEMTFECWVKPSEAIATDSRIFSLAKSNENIGFVFDQSYNNLTDNRALTYSIRLQTQSTNESGYPEYIPDESQNFLNLQHLVYIRNKSGLETIYINGSKTKENFRPSDFSSWENNYYLRLGNESDMNYPWIGSFYSVALYNTALTYDQILTNYKAGPCDSIQHNNLSYDVEAYPNPIKDFLNIKLIPKQLTDINDRVYYRLVDIYGKILYEETIFNPNATYSNDLDFRNYSSGLYFLHLISGNNSITTKLVVQK